MIIKIDHGINVGERRMGVMESQRMEDLQHLENYLGRGHSLTYWVVGKIMRLVLLTVLTRFRCDHPSG